MQSWISEFRKLAQSSQEMLKQASRQTMFYLNFYKDVQMVSNKRPDSSDLISVLQQYDMGGLSIETEAIDKHVLEAQKLLMSISE